MKAKSIIILIMLSFSSIIFSQEWVLVRTTSNGNQFYVRDKPVKKRGNIITIWTKTTGENIKTIKDGNELILKNGYFLQLNDYDCENLRSKLLSVVYYDSEGNVVKSIDSKDFLTEWTYIIPETIGETIINKVCEFYNKTSSD